MALEGERFGVSVEVKAADARVVQKKRNGKGQDFHVFLARRAIGECKDRAPPAPSVLDQFFLALSQSETRTHGSALRSVRRPRQALQHLERFVFPFEDADAIRLQGIEKPFDDSIRELSNTAAARDRGHGFREKRHVPVVFGHVAGIDTGHPVVTPEFFRFQLGVPGHDVIAAEALGGVQRFVGPSDELERAFDVLVLGVEYRDADTDPESNRSVQIFCLGQGATRSSPQRCARKKQGYPAETMRRWRPHIWRSHPTHGGSFAASRRSREGRDPRAS